MENLDRKSKFKRSRWNLFIYNPVDAKRYIEQHEKRLNENGIHQIRYKIFHVNQQLSQLNRAPV